MGGSLASIIGKFVRIVRNFRGVPHGNDDAQLEAELFRLDIQSRAKLAEKLIGYWKYRLVP